MSACFKTLLFLHSYAAITYFWYTTKSIELGGRQMEYWRIGMFGTRLRQLSPLILSVIDFSSLVQCDSILQFGNFKNSDYFFFSIISFPIWKLWLEMGEMLQFIPVWWETTLLSIFILGTNQDIWKVWPWMKTGEQRILMCFSCHFLQVGFGVFLSVRL